MSNECPLPNRIRAFRQLRDWSQEELSQRAGISRAAVSAIEIQRLTPSVEAALSLAAAFGCRVEDLFGRASPLESGPVWAWPPPVDPCRYWVARVADRSVAIPVEATACGLIPHDGVFRGGCFIPSGEIDADRSLVMASCDPAASILAEVVSRKCGYRLIVLPRSSRQAMDLLRRGLVDVAGLHLATADRREDNINEVKSSLGSGYTMLSVTDWQEGVAVGQGVSVSTLASLGRSKVRWVGREAGSGARQCQDELLGNRTAPRRTALDHRGVADAIRCGWADVGVCVRLVSEEAALGFISVREEAYDLCFRELQRSDPRIRAMIQAVQSATFRRTISELPGYDPKHGGEVVTL